MLVRRLIFSLVILLSPIIANSQFESSEKVLYFTDNIIVNKDKSIDVTENISVYANQDKIKHGIIRRLPLQLKANGKTQELQYAIKKILLNDTQAKFQTKEFNDQLKIYIGENGTSLPPGIYTYTLQYHVADVTKSLNNRKEFYWNATGNGWDFAIIKAEIDVHLPSQSQILSFAGETGTKEKKFYARKEGIDHVSFVTTQPLKNGEGLKVTVAWKEKPQKKISNKY